MPCDYLTILPRCQWGKKDIFHPNPCRPIFSRYFRRLWGNVAENRRTSHLPSRKQAVFRVLWIAETCKVGKAERGVWAVEVDDDSDAPPVVLPTERQVKRRQSGQSRSAGPIGPCWIQSAAVWRRCLAAGGRPGGDRRCPPWLGWRGPMRPGGLLGRLGFGSWVCAWRVRKEKAPANRGGWLLVAAGAARCFCSFSAGE